MKNPTLSVVVPVFNESECVTEFLRQSTAVLKKMKIKSEIILVDDGSSDDTAQLIKKFRSKQPNIHLIELSHNYGKAIALTAGLEHSSGSLILMMDPDLQDSPADIPTFLKEINKGYDVVYGLRDAKKDTIISSITSSIFWLLLRRLTDLNIPTNLGTMRIITDEFKEVFLRYREHNRFFEGIFFSIGKKTSFLEITHHPRFSGTSKFNFRRKILLAVDAIIDFSDKPLLFLIKLGVFTFLFSCAMAASIIFLRVFFIEFQLGWPSLIITILISFSANLILSGIIGLYVGRIYMETKHRPLYTVLESTISKHT